MYNIALAGNPNSGKTTTFNAITGMNQYVGNWPGVTVERKSGWDKKSKTMQVHDLPGIYSMSPYTPEEIVARDYLLGSSADVERPEVIMNVVDATNIERNLYLTTQLMETGIPVVVALNMMDVLAKSGREINTEKLSHWLGAPVVGMSALRNDGVDKVLHTCQHEIKKHRRVHKTHELVEGIVEKVPHPIHLNDDDSTHAHHYLYHHHTHFPAYDARLEVALDEIARIVASKVDEDKARWFIVKTFERDEEVMNFLKLSDDEIAEINSIIEDTEKVFDDDAESIITNERYEFITRLVHMSMIQKDEIGVSMSDKIDRVVTNRFAAIPIFILVMWLVYYISIQTVGTIGTDWVNETLFGDWIPGLASDALNSLHVAGWLHDLILDGAIAGVGAVLGFVPQIFVLFICLGILEDCGYMSRIAFIMDRIFRRFGLSGKSFIPILIGTGCGVPGIMASRTIENEKDRRITIMVTTFIPCSAKLPIIALIASAFFGESAWVATSAYVIGMLSIILSGVVLKKIKWFAEKPAPFIMELPMYHSPKWSNVLKYAFDRAWSFIKRAGTIIFAAVVIIWLTSNFDFTLHRVDTEDSILAHIGRLVSWIFTPLGFGNWKATVAAVTGLIAKESVVGTFGILYQGIEGAEDSHALWKLLSESYTHVASYSFLVFNLLCAPCVAAMGAIRREMGTWKWMGIAVAYQCGLAYAVSLVIYQIGSVLFEGGSLGFGFYIAIIVIALMLYFLFRKDKYAKGTIVIGGK
ncbi:MAG: ferrous iron transport protein B [Lactobacillales bacterium]|nr:ferrous iron transport protein B [Lactobacillales bacterium]